MSNRITHNFMVPVRGTDPLKWKCKHCGAVGESLTALIAQPCTEERPATDAELLSAIRGDAHKEGLQ